MLPRLHVDLFFLRGEQVEQQRRDSGLLQSLRNLAIASAVAAAAAAVREQDNARETRRLREITVQPRISRGNADLVGDASWCGRGHGTSSRTTLGPGHARRCRTNSLSL